VRLDHLLSKEEVRVGLLLICQGANLVVESECTGLQVTEEISLLIEDVS
jgi:hypothetical protein